MDSLAESLEIGCISKVWVELGDIRNPESGGKVQISFEVKMKGEFMACIRMISFTIRRHSFQILCRGE